MFKLSDVFTPELAKSLLLDTFKESPIIASKVDDMTSKQLQVFACLVSGYTLSEVGRGLSVDIEDTCLNGRIGELINDFSLPVQRPRIEVQNDNGDDTKRTMYFMNRGDVELLKCPVNSIQVLKAVKRLSCINQKKSETHDLNRAIKRRGRDVATVRMMTVGTNASATVKRRLRIEVNSLLSRFSSDLM
ncbi:hypothetical protein ACU5EH_21810 [Aliivibrio salmonicida]|uniref:hypothetical protein n=1 Tax=Aliivibrio salmonicida TaxID=40269 RepID=UPI00406D396A